MLCFVTISGAPSAQTMTIPGSGGFTIVTVYIDNTQTYRYIAHSAPAPADVSNVGGPLPR